METNQVLIPELLLEAADTLALNLSQSEPFIRYHQANQALNADAAAMLLLKQLSQVQTEVRKHQREGQVGIKEIQHLRALQTQVQGHAVIQEFFTAQQAAVQYLREINQEISQVIGVDFASLAKRSCCC